MTRREERERLTSSSARRASLSRAAEIPLPEPAVLALQRAAGNQAVARFLMRQPTNLTVTDRQAAASERVLTWFVALAREIRQTEPGTPLQSVPELVYMAGELGPDQDGRARSATAMKPAAIEELIRRSAREQGVAAARAPRPRRRPRRAGGGDRDPRQPRPHPDRAHLRQRQREHHDLDRRQGRGQRRRAQARGRDAAGGRRRRAAPRSRATSARSRSTAAPRAPAPRSSAARPRSASTSARASRPRSRPATSSPSRAASCPRATAR